MRFSSRVAGIPCRIVVTAYQPAVPMRITGTGYGDCDPPEEVEFEFEVYDRTGYRAAWLERMVSEDDEERLLGECQNLLLEREAIC